MSKYKKFCEWLERNKIIFNTLCVFLLMAMSVILSYESIRIADTANQIAAYQTSLMVEEKQPWWDIELKYDLGENNNYIKETIKISNEGYPIREFNCEAYVFLYLYATGNDISGDVEGVNVSLIGYYDDILMSENQTGVLAILSNSRIDEGNYKKLMDIIYDGFRQHYHERNASYDVYFVRYIRISYKDVYGETHEQIYSFDDSDRSIRVYETIAELRNNQEGMESLDFSVASSDLILANVGPMRFPPPWAIPIKSSDPGWTYFIMRKEGRIFCVK